MWAVHTGCFHGITATDTEKPYTDKSCGQEKKKAELIVHTAICDVSGIETCVALVTLVEPDGRTVCLQQTPGNIRHTFHDSDL